MRENDLYYIKQSLMKANANLSTLLSPGAIKKMNLPRYASIQHYYMTYLKIFPNGEGTKEFFDFVSKFVENSQSYGNAVDLSYDHKFQQLYKIFICERVANELNIPDLRQANLRPIFSYIYDKVQRNHFFYHCTTPYYAKEIAKNGISPKRKLDNEEINKLYKIAYKYDFLDAFGIWFSSSEGKSFFTEFEHQIFYYADRSPEWFAQLVGESSIYQKIIGEESRDAYSQKDKYMSLTNVKRLLDYYDVEVQDKKEFLSICSDLFDRYSKGNSCLVIVPAETFKSSLGYKRYSFESLLANEKLDDDLIFRLAISSGEDNDFGTTQEVRANDLDIIPIKSYNHFIREVTAKRILDEQKDESNEINNPYSI